MKNLRLSLGTVSLIVFTALAAVMQTQVFAAQNGAIAGNRYRVIISTDIGGDDEDDIQSMIHYLLYADLFDTEGIISSPPMKGRKADIIKVIDVYEKDYPSLKKCSDTYPTPQYLRFISKQGAIAPAPQAGYASPTEGSDWIIRCSEKNDPRPLYLLVWGSITDVAQAIHDRPSIKSKIRVHFIASWNKKHDLNAFRYIDANHADTWFIHNDTTFRGWYSGGRQGGDLANDVFVARHAKGHGALGDYFATLKNGRIKMGDTPAVAYLLTGSPDDPTGPSWGGSFVKMQGRPNWWIDNPAAELAEPQYPGAKTVNRWREEYLRDFQKRFDCCSQRAERPEP
ncbi:MAG: DUF1593 domain-containing protein [Sedimentisphaerales bacterium]|nr:DUF1593 domain-containing protein [Sedimentisphaerales bacterium]